MSRLDDELRRAFRREDPPPDFTARVMKAVAAAPVQKHRWWDELLALFAAPRGRWVALGAAVSLIALILATQYTRLEQGAPKDTDAKHITQPVPATTGGSKETVVATHKEREPKTGVKQQAEVRRASHHHRVRSEGAVTDRRPTVAKSEGEIARDQIMLALHIASASLNEAQRIVKVSEGHQPHTVAR